MNPGALLFFGAVVVGGYYVLTSKQRSTLRRNGGPAPRTLDEVDSELSQQDLYIEYARRKVGEYPDSKYRQMVLDVALERRELLEEERVLAEEDEALYADDSGERECRACGAPTLLRHTPGRPGTVHCAECGKTYLDRPFIETWSRTQGRPYTKSQFAMELARLDEEAPGPRRKRKVP